MEFDGVISVFTASMKSSDFTGLKLKDGVFFNAPLLLASVNVNALTDPSAPLPSPPGLCPPLAQISRNLQRLLQHLYADPNSSPPPRATQITVPQTHGTETVKQPEFTSERINTNPNLGISRSEHPSRRRWTNPIAQPRSSTLFSDPRSSRTDRS